MTSNPYPVPLPRRSTPASITTARLAAGVQSIMLTGLFLFGGLIAAVGLGLAHDRDGFDPSIAALAALIGVASLAPLLLVGLPLLLLRAGRPRARIALIVGEVATGPALAAVAAVQGYGPVLARLNSPLWAYLTLTMITLAALSRPDARMWSAGPRR